MNFDIDIAIVIVFLALTLYIGIGHGGRVKSIKDYALGGRNFSTGALVATIVATWASGSGFFITLSETYENGFYDSFATIGISIAFFIISYILIPRMGEFLGKLSVAEAMGCLYGKKVRVITAISGTIGAAGLVAVQFKAFGNVVSYLTHISPNIAIIISGIIATIYSAFGGIRAVTFTDILQFFAFGVIIPMLGFVIWGQFYNEGYSIASALNEPKFNLEILFDSSSNNFWNFIFLLIYFSIPAITAPLFQRISMGNNVKQIKKAFIYSGIIFIAIQFAISWIPFLIYTINPNIETNSLLPYIVDTFSFSGLKGLIIVAIVAFAMSTADSMINSASVLFTHDIYGLITKNKKHELFVARLFACMLGFGTIILSLANKNLLDIVIFANSFYIPVVLPSFLLTIIGFRSSSTSVLISMVTGLVITIFWKLLPSGFVPLSQNLIGVFFAMICSTIALFASHYILQQQGGWVGIKDTSFLKEQKIARTKRRADLIASFRNFSILNMCKKIAPNNEASYTMLGIYFLVVTFTTMYSTHVELLGEHREVMKIIYPFMMITGTTISMYQIWPLSVSYKIKRTIIQIWFPIAIFYMLIFFSCFFVMVSNFATLQVSLFGMNLILAAILLGWRLSIPMTIIGFYFGVQFYQYIFGNYNFYNNFGSPEFILVYLALLVATATIIFLKPKQEYLEATEDEVGTLKTDVITLDHKVANLNSTISIYNQRVKDQEKEIERLGATAQKILNNVNHELRLPVGNVMNFSEMLHDGLGKFNDDQLKMLSDEVYKNSNRLSSMIMNMLDLATLEAGKLELSKKTINLGELIEDRVNDCRKVYLEGKKINFRLEIHPNLLISVDPNYMRQVVDNLVINSIKFSNEGTVNITLLKKGKFVEFTISDSGIGIPKNDLYDIFTPFKMGSNTESKAEGRGVGLALCRAAIEAHGGTISADSIGGKGAIFKFVL